MSILDVIITCKLSNLVLTTKIMLFNNDDNPLKQTVFGPFTLSIVENTCYKMAAAISSSYAPIGLSYVYVCFMLALSQCRCNAMVTRDQETAVSKRVGCTANKILKCLSTHYRVRAVP